MSASLPASVDDLVIGAGVHGLSTARSQSAAKKCS